MKDTPSQMTRRRFLGQASCALLGTTGLFSSMMHNRLMGQVAAGCDPSDYRATVCVFLLGGNDSYNMLPPRGSSASDPFYQGYLEARGGLPDAGGLALPWDQINSLNPLNPNAPAVGIHHKLPKLRQLFNDDRKLAFVTNVGTLIREGTNSDLINQSGYLPLGAYSHSDQQESWQTCFLEGRSAIGWGGRMVDSLYTSDVPWASNISIGGVNIWQTGDAGRIGASAPFSITPDGAPLIDGPSSGNAAYEAMFSEAVGDLFSSTLESQHPGILDRILHRSLGRSRDQVEELSGILNPPLGEEDPDDALAQSFFDGLEDNPLAQDLKLVARMIALRSQFAFTANTKRQTFFVGLGGWDHHDEVINNQAGLFPLVDDALYAFYEALVGISALDRVTLYTASDFGRTLSSNGRGSDHGWGGNQLVMGGGVDGGKIYGNYPDLSPAALDAEKLNAGRLRVIPTTSVDQYFATIASWMCVPDGELDTIFPNLRNFGTRNLGFMA